MQRIDAHQHFWKFDPVRDSWITEEMAVIKRDFYPADLQPLLAENCFDGCVAVQASQYEEETAFLIELASQNDFIKGVVGWVDLRAANIEERLEYYRQFTVVKGFRHVLQGEPQRDMMLQADFKRGIAALQKSGFTYDILIFPDQIHYSEQLVAQTGEQKFVIDHLAKPYVKRKELEPWKKDMMSIAAHRNVWCKLSGMVTEGDWKGWSIEHFRPYMDVVVEAFGIDRVMFGSDWPVCTVAASYKEVAAMVNDYFASFSADEQAKVFGGNAIKFYGL